MGSNLNETPKRHNLARVRVVWAIKPEIRGRVWPVGEFQKKGTNEKKIVIIQLFAQNPLWYDTIRDAIITCAWKPTWVSLIYRTEPTTKKCKNRKKTKSRKQICTEITVNSLGNPRSESWRRKRTGCGGNDLQKRKDLNLEWKSEWVMEYQVLLV